MKVYNEQSEKYYQYYLQDENMHYHRSKGPIRNHREGMKTLNPKKVIYELFLQRIMMTDVTKAVVPSN
jgi:hypothetical protein